MFLSPLTQFEIYTIVPGLTNLVTYGLLGLIFIIILNLFSRKNNIATSQPGVLSHLLTTLYDSVYSLSINLLGIRFEIQFVVIYILMNIIIIYNLIGMSPYAFTVTSHYSFTIGMSLTIIIVCTILGIIRNKLNFLSLFLPSGTPIALVPLLVVIETISYLARALSLGLRLGANLFSGHSLMLILSGFTTYFVVSMPIISTLPLAFIFILYTMEFAIAILQAYVFVLLTLSYINDAIYLH